MPVYNYSTLDDPLQIGFETIGWGINSAGQVVGFYSNNSGGHGFLYSNGTYTPLDDPLATGDTLAFGINDTGLIVGMYRNISNHGVWLQSRHRHLLHHRPSGRQRRYRGLRHQQLGSNRRE